MNLPDRVEVVIVGGGIIGCSISYHLAKLGITDVLLLERRQLTCGTTWHAAGLVPQLRATRNLTELAKYTSELLYSLEQETGQATGYKQNGSLGVATNPERFEELRRGASMARAFGIDVHILTAKELRERHPLLHTEDLVGGIWLPKDGQTNPVDTTLAFAKGARQRGAKILEAVEVDAILTRHGRACGVRVGSHEIQAGTVVLAAGMWSHELARRVGIRLPLHAAEHFYVVTEAMPELPRNLPVLRAPDEYAYYKEDAGKLLIGAFEPVAKPWGMNGIPKEFCFDALPNDIDHFMPVLEKALHRVPALQSTGIATWFNGPESFTPDDRYLLGETVELRDLFVACGFNSIGIQSSGGVGKVLAQWIVDRQAPMDLADVDVRRLQPLQGTRSYLKARTTESLGLLYAMRWPFRQVETARGVRRSPLHDKLLAQGACMGEYGAWERANWYGAPGSTPEYHYSYGRQNWFAATAAECVATRDAVALYDQSSYPKFLVQGQDACRVLNRISCANVDVPIGKIVYTQWLNPRGGIEADLTLTRLAADQYLVVSSVGSHQRDLAWLREHVPADAHCYVTDVTAAMALIGLMGPASRDLLFALSGVRLDNTNCPFGYSVELEVGHAIVRASRITYVGELGWELYVPTETSVHVFEAIWREGQAFKLKPAGFHAMSACRVEKGYRHWGHDIGPQDTPLEAGLSFCVAWDKPGGFIGEEALKRQRESGPPHRRLVQLRLEDARALLYHDEPIFADGKLVGLTTSGMYGHRLGGSFGMGYINLGTPITAAILNEHRFEIEVAGQRMAARVQLAPFYDPKSLRVQA